MEDTGRIWQDVGSYTTKYRPHAMAALPEIELDMAPSLVGTLQAATSRSLHGVLPSYEGIRTYIVRYRCRSKFDISAPPLKIDLELHL